MEDNKTLVLFVILIIVLAIGLNIYNNKYGEFNRQLREFNIRKQIEQVDTVYNKVTLDSIEYNIVKRDTIIYNIKTEMKDEIKKSKLVTDSDAVKLFNKLVAE